MTLVAVLPGSAGSWLLHVSYAAFKVGNTDPKADHIRARRYMPLAGKGLKGTDLKPDYFETGLFQKGVPHKVTVIKTDRDLFMHIRDLGRSAPRGERRRLWELKGASCSISPTTPGRART
jgi:hypothetical protein